MLGGIFGRLTLQAVSGIERELRRRPAAEIAGGVVGLLLGLLVAVVLSVPLLLTPFVFSWPAIMFIFLVLGSIGMRLGQAKHEDIFGLVGMKPRASMRGAGGSPRRRYERAHRRPDRGPGEHRVRVRHDPAA